MRLRRAGLVIAAVLSLLALPPALEVGAGPGGDGGVALPVAVLVLAIVVAASTLGLLIPAWRGGRAAAAVIATLQLVTALTALPAFFAPADVVPAGGVIAAAAGTLVSIAAFAMIVFDAPTMILQTLAVLAVVALYAGVVAAAGLVVPDPAMRLVQTAAAATVAICFHPLLRALRATVGRALYGGRADPVRAALSIGRLPERGTDAVATALTELARSLRLPRVELVRGDGAVGAVGVAGVRAGVRTVEIPFADSPDRLRVTLRPGERTLQHDDEHALRLAALPLGLLTRESALLDEVRAARAAVVDARERERRALHRDLHDGLGPLLTGAAMRADAARNLLEADPAATRDELDAVRDDLRSAIAEVRRVVYGLWPVELEQRGLWEALRVRATRSDAVYAPPAHPPPLTPAVQRAVYRIVSEALANADRHGRAGTAQVRAEATATGLTVRVENAPAQSPARSSAPPGVGIASMRERAEEVGGRATAGVRDDRWQVEAHFPLAH